jgi:hypothetical protein
VKKALEEHDFIIQIIAGLVITDLLCRLEHTIEQKNLCYQLYFCGQNLFFL